MYPRFLSHFCRCLLLVLTAMLCSAGAGYAQGGGMQVLATADSTQITVGDPVHLHLEANVAMGSGTLQWPSIPDSLGGLEILERGKIDTLKNDNYITYRQQLTLTGFDSGGFYIPSFQFILQNAGGFRVFNQTDSLPLLVQTVAVDTTQPIKPIKDIIEVPYSIWEDAAWIIAGGGALILIAAIILVLLWLRRRRKVEVKPIVPPEPLRVRFLRMLKELEGTGLWEAGEVKEYYVRLTGILRSYLEERFAVPALEQTTDELMILVRQRTALAKYEVLLGRVLQTADSAKFAKAKPMPEEHVNALQATRNFVEETSIPELPAEPESPVA